MKNLYLISAFIMMFSLSAGAKDNKRKAYLKSVYSSCMSNKAVPAQGEIKKEICLCYKKEMGAKKVSTQDLEHFLTQTPSPEAGVTEEQGMKDLIFEYAAELISICIARHATGPL